MVFTIGEIRVILITICCNTNLTHHQIASSSFASVFNISTMFCFVVHRRSFFSSLIRLIIEPIMPLNSKVQWVVWGNVIQANCEVINELLPSCRNYASRLSIGLNYSVRDEENLNIFGLIHVPFSFYLFEMWSILVGSKSLEGGLRRAICLSLPVICQTNYDKAKRFPQHLKVRTKAKSSVATFVYCVQWYKTSDLIIHGMRNESRLFRYQIFKRQMQTLLSEFIDSQGHFQALLLLLAVCHSTTWWNFFLLYQVVSRCRCCFSQHLFRFGLMTSFNEKIRELIHVTRDVWSFVRCYLQEQKLVFRYGFSDLKLVDIKIPPSHD